MKAVIIIPAYNEENVITGIINQIQTITQAIEKFTLHILVFDSNSSDNTQMKIHALQEEYLNIHMLIEKHRRDY